MGGLITQDKNYSYNKNDYRKARSSKEILIPLIIRHEGLEPFQTPFRITFPEMRQWNTIHGYPINKEIVPSKGRENFIYLQNQEDLIPAVIKQFENYMNKPKNYGLPDKPTLEEAIRIFDQTGANGKLDFLKTQGIDTSLSLEEIFNGEK